jgi:hypothetical protein
MWSRLTAHFVSPSPAPRIDFERDMVLVAGLGRRSTGLHEVAVDSVYAEAGKMFVIVRVSAPGDGCIVPLGFTEPVDAVRIRRFEGAIEFIERKEVKPPCSL